MAVLGCDLSFFDRYTEGMSVIDITMNQHYEPLGIYAEGFLDAAAALFNRAVRGEGLVDYAFYPAAYNLRHGIELFVKQMSIYVAYEHRDPARLYAPGHSLADAWKEIRDDVYGWGEYTSSEDNVRDELDIVDDVLEQLHELDPKGTLFRYPEFVRAATEKKPRIRNDEPPPFNVINLRDWASTADAVLEAVRSILYVAEETASGLAQQRGDPPIHFQKTVMARAEKK